MWNYCSHPALLMSLESLTILLIYVKGVGSGSALSPV